MKTIKLGALDPTRDFNFVKDTAAGFIAIADCPDAVGQEINIATGQDISIGDLARKIIAKIEPSAQIVCDQQRLRPEKSEVERLLGDSTKLRNLTGWKPEYDLDRGLDETIAWIKDHMSSYKPDIYNV